VGEIFQIFFKEDYHTKRIGLSLLKKILNWFKKKKIKIIQVESDAKNHSALLFYQKQGFKEKIKILIKDLV
jgi:ribosomal protein S18 acetylase RimI-like enzyme